MNLKYHNTGKSILAEVQSASVEIKSTQDALDLMGEASYAGAEAIIIYLSQICDEFFDLKSGIAGEILQKFSTYRMKLALIGDFSVYSSKSLSDFIFESNKYGHILFVNSLHDALQKLS